MNISKERQEELFNHAASLLTDFSRQSVILERSKKKNGKESKEYADLANNLLSILCEGLTSLEMKKEDNQR